MMPDAAYQDFYQRLLYRVAGWFYDLLAWRFLLIVGGRKGRDFIVEKGGFQSGDIVVALGCGTGAQERLLARRVGPTGQVTGLDVGPAQIERARRLNRAGNARFLLADARETSLPDASADRVLLCYTLHEMPREVRARVLIEARRLLRENGRLVVAEHHLPGKRRWRLIQRVWWLTWVPGNSEKYTAWDMLARGLTAELEAAGFFPEQQWVHQPDEMLQVLVAGKSRFSDQSAQRHSR